MAVNAEDLLIQPFRDVVALAATATSNATIATDEGAKHSAKADQMLQFAKSLEREGERALRKVQAIWNGQVTLHGDAFRERMLKQGKHFPAQSYILTFIRPRYSYHVQALLKTGGSDLKTSSGTLKMQLSRKTSARSAIRLCRLQQRR
jgi:hypothetical protein